MNNKLPSGCYALHPITETPVWIDRDKGGYYETPNVSVQEAQWINERNGITSNQVNAMLIGSMFGWDAPAADPDAEMNKIVDPYKIMTRH